MVGWIWEQRMRTLKLLPFPLKVRRGWRRFLYETYYGERKISAGVAAVQQYDTFAVERLASLSSKESAQRRRH